VLGVSVQGAETVGIDDGYVSDSGDKFHGHGVLGRDSCRGE
jgi:hypothetical protein